MTTLIRCALLLGALLAFAAQAQDTQKPEAATTEAAKPPAPAGPGQEPDPRIIENIMNCLADGLTPDWRKAWFIVRQFNRNAAGTQRDYAAVFFYSTSDDDKKGQRLQVCNAERIVASVGQLNAYLPDSQQRWSAATFTFYRDGRYEATYDQTPFKAKPAAKKKAPAPKKQEAAK